jgi:uncharacterized membrane protein YeaQ/YmgE (transglycosylase-associated protein family)
MITITLGGSSIDFDLVSILVYLIVGLVAGYLASLIMRRRGTLLGDLILGVLGAFVGGILFSLLAPVISINISPVILRDIITAFIGALLIIALVRVFSRRRR